MLLRPDKAVLAVLAALDEANRGCGVPPLLPLRINTWLSFPRRWKSWKMMKRRAFVELNFVSLSRSLRPCVSSVLESLVCLLSHLHGQKHIYLSIDSTNTRGLSKNSIPSRLFGFLETRRLPDFPRRTSYQACTYILQESS